MRENTKYESLRIGGTELLRVGKHLFGFENVPQKILNFYFSLAENSAASAYESLTPIAEKAFENAKKESPRAIAFFRRFNYLIECRAEMIGEGYLKVCVKATLSRSSEELCSVKNVHFWNMSEQTLISENGLKKALLKKSKFVKK